MELSVEPACQHVTWKVHDFFQLPSEIDYSIDSPEFRFANDSYCLRLYPNEDRYGDTIDIRLQLVRLTSIFLERNVSCTLGYMYRTLKGTEIDNYMTSSTLTDQLSLSRSGFEEQRDMYVPDGTFTVLCSMRLEEQISVASPKSEEAVTSVAEERLERLPGQFTFFSSCWRSSKMELSIESPCQYITWKVQDFFQLPSEIGYSLDSPEFRFADFRYCLRLYPNGCRNEYTTHIDLQLVSLTSSVPERIVLCKLGCRGFTGITLLEFDFYECPGTLNDECGFRTLSRSELEKDRDVYFPDGSFTVLCSMWLGEQSGA